MTPVTTALQCGRNDLCPVEVEKNTKNVLENNGSDSVSKYLVGFRSQTIITDAWLTKTPITPAMKNAGIKHKSTPVMAPT